MTQLPTGGGTSYATGPLASIDMGTGSILMLSDIYQAAYLQIYRLASGFTLFVEITFSGVPSVLLNHSTTLFMTGG